MATISNQASVSFSYEGATRTRVSQSNLVNSEVLDQYSITADKSSTSTGFRAGDTITFMVNVTNSGAMSVNNFSINDDLTGQGYLSYVEDTGRLFIDGVMRTVVPTGTNPLTFSIPDSLERGTSFYLQYNAIVSEDIALDVSEISNTVNVTASAVGDTATTVTATDTLTIPVSQYANILVTKAVSDQDVYEGESFNYTLTLTNTGNIDATDVVITDSLPTGFNVSSISMENNGVVYTFDPSEYTISPTNELTLPNDTGRAILIPAIAPGVDNTTRITITGSV